MNSLDDSSIINEFIYYLSFVLLMKSLNKWIHILHEFTWFTRLDEIIYSLIMINLTEFICYVNPYVKWNHCTNEFIYSILSRNTLVSFLHLFCCLILERWETQFIVLANCWPYNRNNLLLLQAMVLDTGGIDIPAKMARLYA
jgi:hypothetical protein